jgi:glycosyltransferase involved in cell wall biosynthesis
MNDDVPPTRRLRVIVLPNKPWMPYINSFRPGQDPDPDRLRRLLAERGIDFMVVDPFSPPYNPLGRGHPFFAGLDPLRALVVLLRHRSADLVISVFESGAVVLILLRRLLFFKPKVALWDVSVGSAWRPRRLALRLVLPRVEKLFGLTRWQKAAAERQYRLRAPADVVGFAVDEDFYHPDFNRGADYVLSVGEDVARDYATLVAAVRDLPATVILKTPRAVSLPADSTATVTIMRERLSSLRLRDLYASASIVVIPLLPSDHPSGISSLFEAMAMGKPIIASDVPMIREFITSGDTGLIVPAGDAAALRDAIAFLLARPDERRRLGINVRRHLDAHLTLAAFADRYAAYIRNVVRPAPALGGAE